MNKASSSHQRFLHFLNLYEKHYSTRLSLEEGREIWHSLLSLLEAVQEAMPGRHNNAALVSYLKKADE